MPSSAGPAIVTMVYDEADYLSIWVSYWKRFLPEESLFVLIDGESSELKELAKGCNVICRDRPAPYEEMERDRWLMLSQFVSDLTSIFGVVVYTDVDEILVMDPAKGINVAEALRSVNTPASFATGLEIVHRPDKEPMPIDISRPILMQRQYFRPTTYHSKPSIVREPIIWQRGGHYCNKAVIDFIPDLYAVHLRFYDQDRFRERARVRRETTLAPAGYNNTPYRRWRADDAGLEAVLSEFNTLRLPIFRSLITWHMRKFMKQTFKEDECIPNFYTYNLYASKRLQKLPRRFLKEL
jgi:hypothetical protein